MPRLLGPGLNSPEPIGKFLNGNLPSLTPGDGQNISWNVVPAFPNLSFQDPLAIVPHPRENRIFVASRQGVIEHFENDQNTTTKQQFANLSNDVAVVWDGGFLGMAFHPDFGLDGSPNRNYVYMFYTAKGPNGQFGPVVCDNTCFSCENDYDFFGSYLRLSRFSVYDGTLTVNPSSELRMINIQQYNGTHRGGAVDFGNDGFLYLAIGDQARRTTAQNIVNNFEGGIIRIDVNQTGGNISHPPRRKMGVHTGFADEFTGVGYYVPNDNPWLDTNNGLFEEFVHNGHRNPHRMTKDRATGDFWIGEIGAASREEISVLKIGYNGGWPIYEGNLYQQFTACGSNNLPLGLGTYNPPVMDFMRSEANAIIGGYVYRGSKFPSLFGKYICGDYAQKRIFAIEETSNGNYTKDHFATFDPGRLITFGEGPDGELYMGRQENSTSLYTLQATGGNPPAPTLLSQTGTFSNLNNLTPSQGVIPYDMIEPFWSDGAEKNRWMAIPNNGTHNTIVEQIQFSADGNWVFPNGAVLIKHFELGGKRLETRFEVKGDDGVYYYLTYKWNDAQTDAELLESALDEEVFVNGQSQIWHYPSRSECLNCHLTEVGSVLGTKTRHLNKNITYPSTGINANQLVTLSHLGILNETINDGNVGTYMAVAAKDDTNASLEYRARSYLDVNCSNCHQPATANRAQFDARITTPLDEQNYINGAVIYDLGLSDPRVVVPQDLTHSVLYQRMSSLQGGIAMPPLAKNVVDTEGLQLIANWINSLSPEATNDLITTGNASQLDGGCYEITPNTTNQAGAAWYPQAIDFSDDVIISFSAKLGEIDAGADGMALIFQTQGTNVSTGSIGNNLGASGISPSLGIEFDTFNDGGFDLANDHIGIFRNGNLNNILATAVCMDSNCNNTEDGQIHTIQVQWDFSQKRLTIFFDDEQRIVYTNDFISSIFSGNNNLYVGVTGGTSFNTAQQTICSFNVDELATNTPPTAIASSSALSGTAPLQIAFSGTDSSDPDGDNLSYNWNLGDGTFISGNNINHTYTSPGNYTAVLTVDDGQAFNQSSINITVHPPSTGNNINFADQTSLLGGSNYSGVAFAIADMNADGKDDIIRYNQAKNLNIQYQLNPNQAFNSFGYGAVSGANQWSTCIADFDKNGYNDILVGGAYDGIKIIKNNGNNSYNSSFLPDDYIFLQGSNFVDINNDGWVDIFACHDNAESRGYVNNQNGTFTWSPSMISTETVPASDNSGNYASIWTDYDNDGDIDLYISKCRIGVQDSTDPRRINMLWQNDGNGNFTEVSAAANLKIGAQSWLTDFGDIDNDGDLDCIVVNHYVNSQLMRNNGDGTFTEITNISGLLPSLSGSNSFGIQALFRDFNNDGFVDLIFSGTKHYFFYNNGNGSFSQAPNPFNTNQIESIAVGDLNHDGFVDVYAGYANLFTSPSSTEDRLFINEGNNNHFIAVQLEGTVSNINGIGAKVELYGSWGKQLREVRSGEGYGIMNSFTQHFGIGAATQIDKIVVHWPSGIVQEVNNPAIDQYLTIIECNIGSPCNDNDVCTINDVIDANCNCTGTFQDSDNDGICDANESNCNGLVQYPYDCITRTLPTILQLEEYDEGGPGIAHQDDGVRNGDLNFRPDDNVDVVNGIIGWIKNGEWLEYTVNVPEGIYNIKLPATSNSSNPGAVNVSIDGTFLANFDIQNTGGWGSSSYTTFTVNNVFIGGGNNRVIRLSMLGGSFNLNYIEFELVSSGCTVGSPCNDNDDCTINDALDSNCNCTGTLLDNNNNGICDNEESACNGLPQYPYDCNYLTIPTTIQVEEYDEGGEGIAHHDDGVRNGNINFRPDDNVDVVSGVVGWIKDGEWLEYTVDVQGGYYDIVLPATSNSSNPGTVILSVDGSQIATFDIQNTGGWGGSSYQDFVATNIFIGGGSSRVLRLEMDGGSFNLDYIEFNLATAGCNVGDPCNDNDACTTNDAYNNSCDCIGIFLDSDNDGICDANDICPNDSNNNCNTIDYCDLVGTNSNYEFIQKVVLGSINNDSGNNGGYGDFTNLSTNLSLGQSYSIQLTPGFANNTYNEAFTVWIDFNKNGSFDDANEEVFTGTSNTVVNGTISIPNNALAGATRMRVAMRWNSPQVNPCGNISYGEVEDYTVNIGGVLPFISHFNPITTGLEMTVFPNPVNDKLNVAFNETIEQGTLEIFNKIGVSVYRISLENIAYQTTLDVNNLPAGTYFVRLSQDNKVSLTERFIKIN